MFLVLDELPTRTLVDSTGSLDAVRFPSFNALAEDATWYRQNTTLATYTSAAVPALLTGQLPTTDPPLWTSHPKSLFTLLAPTHDLAVFETVTAMCPYTTCEPATDGATVTDDGRPGFGDLLDVAADVWFERVRPRAYEPPALEGFDEASIERPLVQASTAEDPVDAGSDLGFDEDSMRATAVRAEQLIESFDPTDGPTLYYLHLMLPHQPWARYPEGDLYRVSDPANVGVAEGDLPYAWSWSDWEATVSEQRHTIQAQYVDRLLGRIMEELRANGLYDRSLIVVMSDHGLSLEERTDQRAVYRDTIDAVGYAPLLVKEPQQQKGAVDDTNVMTIDIVPTVADILGLEIDWPVDGLPLGSSEAARGDRTKRIYDFSGFTQLNLDEVLEFDDGDVAESVPNSWLGDPPDGADTLWALNELLGIGELVGQPLDDLVHGEDGVAEVSALDDIRAPPAERPPIGLVTGRVPGAPDDGVILLAIDGDVVGGSRFSTAADNSDGRFSVLLPPGALDGTNDVRAAR